MAFDGDQYQARFDELAATGADVHGEAPFVASLHPRTVLDAGCGTGRVAIELARRGFDTVGVDGDPSMLATAQRLAPHLTWVHADLATYDAHCDTARLVLAARHATWDGEPFSGDGSYAVSVHRRSAV